MAMRFHRLIAPMAVEITMSSSTKNCEFFVGELTAPPLIDVVRSVNLRDAGQDFRLGQSDPLAQGVEAGRRF
jgi:hypothetical protein